MKTYAEVKWKITLKIIIALTIFCCRSVSAQDTIVLVTDTKLIVDIKELNKEFVLFSLWSDSTSITKLPIERIKSISGHNDNEFPAYFDPELEKSVMAEFPTDSTAIVAKAIADADSTYTGSNGAGAATFFSTVIGTPVLGLIIAIPASSSPPPINLLKPPHPSMLNNITYRDAYQKQAHKIKKRKIWVAFGVGVVVDAILFGLIMSSVNNIAGGY